MNVRKLLDWRKLLIYSHRWLGIVAGLVDGQPVGGNQRSVDRAKCIQGMSGQEWAGRVEATEKNGTFSLKLY